MLDEQPEHQDGSFIVRIWWERGGGECRSSHHWRGWIQHVRTGNQSPFRTMNDLAGFIEQELGILPATGEAPQGLG